MGLIPDSVIGEIRERSDIVAVIGQHVQLKKAGQNHKGLCPFHDEKTPSFNVNGPKGFYYCFGCHKKGDVFSFVMEYEGKSFVEAAESLAGRLGIQIPKTEEPEHVRRERNERAQLLRVNKLATEFFVGQLCSDRGDAGRRYLAGRGIGQAVTENFQLGLAPDSWSALTDHLESIRVPMDLAVTLGLVVKRPNSSGYYDRFRNRLMCPIIMPGGEVAGFSGRTLADSSDEKAGAKYINSPDSPVYKKSRLLFGLHRARTAFHKSKRAVVVEGNFDVMALHEAGFEETVAPLGTALTTQQADQLRRLADKVVLMYDGDKAGRAATLKALRVLVAAGIDTRVIVVPKGEDPDNLVKRLGPDKFGELLSRAQGGIQYFAYEVWGKNTGSNHSQAEALAEASSVIRAIKNPTERDFVIGTLAKALNVDSQVVRRGVSRAQQNNNSEQKQTQSEPAPAPVGRRPPPHDMELALLAILAEHPQLMETAEQNSVFSLLTDERLRDMYCAARQNRTYLSSPSEWPHEVSPLLAKQMLAGAYADVKDPKHCLTEAIGGLKRLQQRARLAALKREAQVAKRRGDVELERKLVREILITRRQVD